MRYLPLFADLNSKPCLVVGGGSVGERRVRQLLAAGAAVTVIAPHLTRPLAALAADGRIEHDAGPFADADLGPFWLVVAATDDSALNARVAAAATAARRFCNVVDAPALCTYIMPTIVDRDPITIAVSTGGAAPVVARWVRRLIEDAIPARSGRLAALAGRWRERVAATLPDLGIRRRFWEAGVDGEIGALALAGRDDDAEKALDAALEAWRSGANDAAAGEAWLVGAGPGDPELITLRGRYLLAQADVVLYDRLVNPRILEYARRDAELIAVGKEAGKPSIGQAEINALLVRHVAAGQRVCRLKGGDPMIFGRIGEELDALVDAGLPFQIVPGVSAAEGCAAYAGIPLTLRSESQAVLIATGHTLEHVESDLSGFQSRQTLALYMSLRRIGDVTTRLLDLGHSPDLPAAVIENGTTEHQRVIQATLGTLAARVARHEIRSPALVLIGETIRHAARYAWFGAAATEDDGAVPARVS